MIYLGAERFLTNSYENHETAEDYSGVHTSNVSMYGRGKVIRVINSFTSYEDSINYGSFLQNRNQWKDGNYYNCISITGKLVRMRYDELGGNQVFIETYDNGNKLIFRFAHLDSVLVNVGDIVDSNTIIGRQGNTGLVSSSKSFNDVTYGSHVHLEITDRNGIYINPRKYATGEVVTDYIIQSNEIDESKRQFRVMVDKINIREHPSVESADIGDVFMNEIYTILDETLDDKYNWYHIKTSYGIDGYVASKIGLNWVELLNQTLPCDDLKNNCCNNSYKLLFTCSKNGTYYLKLFEREELYIKEKL